MSSVETIASVNTATQRPDFRYIARMHTLSGIGTTAMIILPILVILVIIAEMSGRVYLKSRDIKQTRRIVKSKSRQTAAWQSVLNQNARPRNSLVEEKPGLSTALILC